MVEEKTPYWRTEKGRAAAKRYRQSDKGKAAAQRYRQKNRKVQPDKVIEIPE